MYKQGDVVKIVQCEYKEFIGKECTILGLDFTGRDHYLIEIEGISPLKYRCKVFTARHSNLRPLPPPLKVLPNWDGLENIFEPKNTHVEVVGDKE